MRTRLLIANWKMHKTSSEALSYVRDFRKLILQVHDVEIVIAPPFTAVGVVAEAIKGTALEVAGQDLHWEKQGAFTGAVSATMLKEAGAGHIRVFGGGGGTITPEEISELERYGVEKIYHPNDGMKMGLDGMVDDLIKRTRSHQKKSRLPEKIDK